MRLGLVSAATALAIGAASPAFADDMFSVVERGYSLFRRIGYLSYEGCEFNRAYDLGEYIFICEGYDYSYSYGRALVLTVSGEAGGRAFLCTDEGECVAGHLVASRR